MDAKKTEAILEKFNKALAALTGHFSGRKFSRTEPLTLEEISVNPDEKFARKLAALLKVNFSEEHYVEIRRRAPIKIIIRSPVEDTFPLRNTPDKVSISYTFPATDGKGEYPLLHVMLYDPNEAEGVEKVLRGVGLSPKCHMRDYRNYRGEENPYTEVDIDAILDSS